MTLNVRTSQYHACLNRTCMVSSQDDTCKDNETPPCNTTLCFHSILQLILSCMPAKNILEPFYHLLQKKIQLWRLLNGLHGIQQALHRKRLALSALLRDPRHKHHDRAIGCSLLMSTIKDLVGAMKDD